MAEKRNTQRSFVAGRMKALGQASVMEQIMVRFVSSAAQNQEQLRKCREQYQFLLRKQNEAAGEDEAAVYEDQLKFDSIREILKETASPQEQ